MIGLSPRSWGRALVQLRERGWGWLRAVAAASIATPARRRGWWILAASMSLIVVALLALVALGGGYRPLSPAVVQENPEASPKELTQRIRKAEASLLRNRPTGVYVVVDSYGGHLRVYRNGERLREAVCSAGSGGALVDPRSGRIWVFRTPLGERRVQRKVKDPVWVKPDWAFVEEGYAPPPLGHRDRVDTFSLGDYGLYLGDGYIIHGTVFQSLLGRRVTHGCVRLGDDDLRYVYEKVPLGARVYLY